MILTSVSQLAVVPKRIVSLVPSQTELLYSLGLEDEVIGITKFCIHPSQWFNNKIRVGGTKNVDIHKIAELKPDLIIANKEENVRTQVEELAKNCNVWVTGVETLDDSINMIKDIGLITNRVEQSVDIISKLKFEFEKLVHSPSIPVGYLIWRDPYMTIGGDTFINDMLQKAGFENVFAHRKRYPEVSVEEIKNSSAKVLLLSSEPFPFKQKHMDELREQLPGIVIKLADGELFSWYGSRLLHSPAYFKQLRVEVENDLR